MPFFLKRFRNVQQAALLDLKNMRFACPAPRRVGGIYLVSNSLTWTQRMDVCRASFDKCASNVCPEGAVRGKVLLKLICHCWLNRFVKRNTWHQICRDLILMVMHTADPHVPVPQRARGSGQPPYCKGIDGWLSPRALRAQPPCQATAKASSGSGTIQTLAKSPPVLLVQVVYKIHGAIGNMYSVSYQDE